MSTSDDAYRIATGQEPPVATDQDPPVAAESVKAAGGGYLSTEELCGLLAKAGVDEATVGKVFAARLQPLNLDEADRDRKFVMGVPGPFGTAFLVIYQFGLGAPLTRKDPLDEGGPDWRPRWISVEGPFDGADRKAVAAKARELTA